jgi:hypothetical protein
MSQYSEVLDRITLDWLNRPDLRPEAARAVKAAIRTYETQRWWFNETSTAIATVSSQGYIDAPSNMLAFDELRITVSSVDCALSNVDLPQLLVLRSGRPFGRPTHYCYHADRFELAATPDSAWDCPLYYIKQLPVLSADTDTNAWTTFGENLIAHTAAMDLLIGMLRGPDADIQRHALGATAGRVELARQNDSRLLRKLRPTRL